jgi:GTP cyclohydrolase IA
MVDHAWSSAAAGVRTDPSIALRSSPPPRTSDVARQLPLRIVNPRPRIDYSAAERAVRSLLLALGQDPDTEHLLRTPQRVARAYAELLRPEEFDLTTFANDEDYDELVLVRDIPFRSLCEHHMLPFRGVAHVGYLPDQRIVGLSKLARVVESFAQGMQVQERLTQQVADCLDSHLSPKGVGVVIEAEHHCMSMRGVRAQGAVTSTSAVRGQLRHDPAARQEFFSLVRSR